MVYLSVFILLVTYIPLLIFSERIAAASMYPHVFAVITVIYLIVNRLKPQLNLDLALVVMFTMYVTVLYTPLGNIVQIIADFFVTIFI